MCSTLIPNPADWFSAHSRVSGNPEQNPPWILDPRFPPSLKLRRTESQPAEALAQAGRGDERTLNTDFA